MISNLHTPGPEHVFTHPDGSMLVSFEGARLELRADGSHRWSNVQPESDLYRAMNDVACAVRSDEAARYARASDAYARAKLRASNPL